MKSGNDSARRVSEAAVLDRRLAVTELRPVIVTVLPLDTRTATSPVSAALATVLAAVSPVPVAAVDADGTAQPLRRLLGSTGAGDLIGLATSHDATLRRQSVEDFVDMGARVPLASCWLDGPGAIPPLVLRDAMWKLRRRFPSLVVDVPHGVPIPTLTTASDLASHVILVGDAADIGHDWLHDGDSVVSRLAARGAVTVVAIGGGPADRRACKRCDIVPLATINAGAEGGLLAEDGVAYGLGEVVTRLTESAAAGQKRE